ncbi:MAG: hypothetical protein JSR78_10685 [Proteobacteria bacterium]|nr:hypothetical protein [Pseudomonadota bacterium]
MDALERKVKRMVSVTFVVEEGEITAPNELQLHVGGDLVAVISYLDRKVYVCSLDDLQLVKVFDFPSHREVVFHSFRMSPSHITYLSGSAEMSVYCLRSDDQLRLKCVSDIRCVSLSDDRLYVMYWYGGIDYYDTNTWIRHSFVTLGSFVFKNYRGVFLHVLLDGTVLFGTSCSLFAYSSDGEELYSLSSASPIENGCSLIFNMPLLNFIRSGQRHTDSLVWKDLYKLNAPLYHVDDSMIAVTPGQVIFYRLCMRKH